MQTIRDHKKVLNVLLYLLSLQIKIIINQY